jgi:CheY-like chemotaxis protein
MKVLYIEDNLSNLDLVGQVLKHYTTLEILPATGGQMGLDLATEHHPALVLLDLHLPDMPGVEVVERLRADPSTRDIPVVVLSADATAAAANEALEAGADGFLTKPFEVRNLVSLIEKTVSQGQAPGR